MRYLCQITCIFWSEVTEAAAEPGMALYSCFTDWVVLPVNWLGHLKSPECLLLQVASTQLFNMSLWRQSTAPPLIVSFLLIMTWAGRCVRNELTTHIIFWHAALYMCITCSKSKSLNHSDIKCIQEEASRSMRQIKSRVNLILSVFLAYLGLLAAKMMDLRIYLLFLISFTHTFSLCKWCVLVHYVTSVAIVWGDSAHRIHKDISHWKTSQPTNKSRLQCRASIIASAGCNTLGTAVKHLLRILII